MGIIVGITFVALGIAVYATLLRLAVYRRKPWESAMLMAMGVGAAVTQFVTRPDLAAGGVAAGLAAFTSVFVYVTMIYARSPRASLKVKVGSPFPAVPVTSQDGKEIVVGGAESRELSGPRGTLYVFYRGHW